MEEILQNQATANADLSALVINLLKGVIYQEGDPVLWDGLIRLQPQVRDYVSVLGLDLVLDEAEGYAFLKSKPEGAEKSKIPRLIARRPLTFQVSLLLALLRKKLAEFDAGGGETRLVLTLEEIVELVRVFLPESSNEAKLVDGIETQLNRIIDLGFLRRLKPTGSAGGQVSYEVRRILKAFVDAQWLAEFDCKLEAYRAQLVAGSGDETNE